MTTLYAVLLGCLRKSISRILVLIVSMGFGVVLPYLGAIQHKVTIILQTSCEGTDCMWCAQGIWPVHPGFAEHLTSNPDRESCELLFEQVQSANKIQQTASMRHSQPSESLYIHVMGALSSLCYVCAGCTQG